MLAFLFMVNFTGAQPVEEYINRYFTNIYEYPLRSTDLFTYGKLNGNIDSISIFIDDTLQFRSNFIENKLSRLETENSTMIFQYKDEKLLKIQTITKLKTDEENFNYQNASILYSNGDENVIYKRDNNKIKDVISLLNNDTLSRYVLDYDKNKIQKITTYGRPPIVNKGLYPAEYKTYRFENDTIIFEKNFDYNDSLASQVKYIFNKKGDILSIQKLTKKRDNGIGIDVKYYSYDNNKVDLIHYEYTFDKELNWTLRTEYQNGIVSRTIKRKIKYKK